jgi:hypothetical protein
LRAGGEAREATPTHGWSPTEAMSIPSRRSSLVSMLVSTGDRVIERVRGWNAALAQRPAVSLVLVVVISFLLAVGGAAGVGFPEPVVHDEQSYLLGAETFAAGRLTNPPHPMAEHFRTFHVLQQPTYASKYPPGQAVALALGIRLAGTPLVGVWLSFALMCAGIYWMLRAWVGPRWALAGAIALALRLATSYWTYQYWGGAVAALGGALVLGGARRVVDSARPRDAVLMTVGAALLANSRPFEGLLLCVPVAIVVLWWLVREHSNRRRLVGVLLPAAAVVAVTGAAMLRYNYAVTGRATQLPYLEYREQHGRGPDFIWAERRNVPLSTDTLMRRYQEWELATADSLRSPAGFASRNLDRLKSTIPFFLPVFLLAPLFVLPIVLRDRWSRLALVCLGVVLTGLAFSSWYQPHYAAPATALFIVLYVSCVAWCRRIRLGRFDAGKYFVAIIVAGWMVSQLAKLAVPIARTMRTGATPDWSQWARRRSNIERELQREAGRDLVIVRYAANHHFHHEWVWNHADIDQAGVVWARDLGSAKNAQLMRYFRDRKAWLLEVNDSTGVERRRSVTPDKPNE